MLGQKLMSTQCGVGRCARKPPTVKRAHAVTVSQKLTETEHSLSQQRQLVP